MSQSVGQWQQVVPGPPSHWCVACWGHQWTPSSSSQLAAHRCCPFACQCNSQWCAGNTKLNDNLFSISSFSFFFFSFVHHKKQLKGNKKYIKNKTLIVTPTRLKVEWPKEVSFGWKLHCIVENISNERRISFDQLKYNNHSHTQKKVVQSSTINDKKNWRCIHKVVVIKLQFLSHGKPILLTWKYSGVEAEEKLKLRHRWSSGLYFFMKALMVTVLAEPGSPISNTPWKENV